MVRVFIWSSTEVTFTQIHNSSETMNSARRRGAIAQMKINHARETRVARHEAGAATRNRVGATCIDVRRMRADRGARGAPTLGGERVVNDAQSRLPALCSCGNMQANTRAARGHAERRMSMCPLVSARDETVNAQLAVSGSRSAFVGWAKARMP
jgi:hypothetical protein